MDYELWSKFATSKAVFGYIDADISGNRWYETTKTAANTLDLYAEVIATQHKLFGGVSPFFVQAVSDHLYAKFHSPFYGDSNHLVVRWFYFKLFWSLLNFRFPKHWLKGLFTETMSKSGPIIGDRLSFRELITAGRNAMRGGQ